MRRFLIIIAGGGIAVACHQLLDIDNRRPDASIPMDACGPCGCVDFVHDPHHCGTCDRDCLTGKCVASVCQPELLYENDDAGPGCLVAMKDNVVFGCALTNYDEGSRDLFRIPKAGGTPTKIGTYILPFDMARDGDDIVLASRTSVMKLREDGSGVKTLFNGSSNDNRDLEIFDKTAYVIHRFDGLWRAPFDGDASNVERFEAGSKVHVDSTGIYVARDNDLTLDGAVSKRVTTLFRLGLDASPADAEPDAAGYAPGNVTAMAGIDGSVFLGVGLYGNDSDKLVLWKGQNVTPLYPPLAPIKRPVKMTIADSYVYVADVDEFPFDQYPGHIWRFDAKSETWFFIADARNVQCLDTDDRYLYYSAQTGDQLAQRALYRVAR